MLTASALLLLAPVLLSQSQPAAAAQPPASASQVAADPAWALYAEAFRAAAEGRNQDALELLERLAKEHPGHPAAASAAQIAEALTARTVARPGASPAPAPPPVPAPDAAIAKTAPEDLGTRLRAEEPTALARAELTIFQTLHGIALGSEICGAMSCSDSRAFILMSMFGGGAGLSASLLAVASVTPGLTLSLDSGTGWGVWNGIALNTILSSGNTRRSQEAIWATMVGSQLVGLAAGGLVYTGLRPGAGDVSLANSAGIWSGVMAALLLGAVDYQGDEAGWLTTLMAVSDTGLFLGGVLASQAPMSRSRSLIIDAGGVLGLLLGLGIDALAENNHITQGPFFTLGMVGAASGLGTAAFLTRDWDSAALEGARMSLVPASRGRGATLSLAVDF